LNRKRGGRHSKGAVYTPISRQTDGRNGVGEKKGGAEEGVLVPVDVTWYLKQRERKTSTSFLGGPSKKIRSKTDRVKKKKQLGREEAVGQGQLGRKFGTRSKMLNRREDAVALRVT